MNPQAYAQLSSRIRPNGPGSTYMLNCLNRVASVSTAFDEKRAQIAADQHLSDVGRRAKIADLAKSMVRDVLDAGKPQKMAMAQVVGQRLNLKPRPVATTDARGELRRQEVRAYVRSLDPTKRFATAMELAADDEALSALLDASPVLCGLPATQHAHLGKLYADKHFGDKVAELDGIESDCTAVGAGIEMVMNDLRAASGLPEHAFAEHVRAVQEEADL